MKLIKLFTRKFKKDLEFKDLIQGSFVSLLIKFLSIGIGYLFTFLIIKYFSNTHWGVFSLSFTVMQIFAILGRLGTDTAILKFTSQFGSTGRIAKLKGTYHQVLLLVLFSSILVSACMFFGAEVLANHFFKKAYLAGNFKIISLGILPLNFIYLNAESFRGLKRPREFSFFKTISFYILAIPFLFLLFPWVDSNLIPETSFVIGLYSGAVLSFYLWYKNSKILPVKGEKEMSINEILKLSMPMLLSSSLIFLLGWTSTIILGVFKSDDEVGIYNVVLKLANLTSLALMAVNTVSAPKFAEFFTKNDFVALEKVIRQSTKITFWVSTPILICFILFSHYILLFFGKEFQVGAMALTMLSIGQFVSSMCGSVGYLLQMTGHQNERRNIMFFSTALNIGLNYLLIPTYGISGAAFASMVGVISSNLATVYIIKKKLNIYTLYFPSFRKKSEAAVSEH